MLNKESSTSDYLYSIFNQYNLELNPEIELTSNDLLIDLARIGLGIAFIPDFCIPRQTRDLFVIKLSEPIPNRALAIAYGNQIPLSHAAQSFIDLLAYKI